jgi:hypothetical protein
MVLIRRGCDSQIFRLFKQTKRSDFSEVAIDQFLPNVTPVACIGNVDFRRKLIGCLACLLNCRALARNNERGTIRTGGDKPTLLQADLTIMQMSALSGRQFTVNEDWKTGGLWQPVPGIRKRRRRDDNPDAKTIGGFELAARFIDHFLEKLAPANALKRIENGVTRVTESACEFERPNTLFVYDRVEVDVSAIAALSQQGLNFG